MWAPPAETRLVAFPPRDDGYPSDVDTALCSPMGTDGWTALNPPLGDGGQLAEVVESHDLPVDCVVEQRAVDPPDALLAHARGDLSVLRPACTDPEDGTRAPRLTPDADELHVDSRVGEIRAVDARTDLAPDLIDAAPGGEAEGRGAVVDGIGVATDFRSTQPFLLGTHPRGRGTERDGRGERLLDALGVGTSRRVDPDAPLVLLDGATPVPSDRESTTAVDALRGRYADGLTVDLVVNPTGEVGPLPGTRDRLDNASTLDYDETVSTADGPVTVSTSPYEVEWRRGVHAEPMTVERAVVDGDAVALPPRLTRNMSDAGVAAARRETESLLDDR